MRPFDHYTLFESRFAKLVRLTDSNYYGPYAVWFKPSHSFATDRMSVPSARQWLRHFGNVSIPDQDAAIAKAEAWAKQSSQTQSL